MNTMHLFAGGGGGLLADLILGNNPIVAVEWDKYACKILRERAEDGWFPDLSVWEGDVRMFDPSEYAGKVDCIHAGFPCQDISVAGKQAGVGKETRSGLYREVIRIADVVRPKELFLENVSAILYNGLGTVLADLSSRGYSARWICLRASDVGANHGRDRWWLLARKMGDTMRIGHIKSSIISKHNCYKKWNSKAYREIRERVSNEIKPSCEDVAYTYKPQCKGNKRAERSKQEYSNSGKPGWWEVEPRVGRVVDELADRVGKLKSLGNGQVPLQAAVAYSILNELFVDSNSKINDNIRTS